MCGDLRQSSEGKAGDENYIVVALLIKQISDLNWISLFVWLALNKTTESGTSEPQPLNENETQTASSFHPSAARFSVCLSFFFLSLYRFLRLSPVISRSKGCDVTSCLVFTASIYKGSSLLTAVSRAGNMQINEVKGESSLIVSVRKPSQLLFRITLESLNMFQMLFDMWLTLNLLFVNAQLLYRCLKINFPKQYRFTGEIFA